MMTWIHNHIVFIPFHWRVPIDLVYTWLIKAQQLTLNNVLKHKMQLNTFIISLHSEQLILLSYLDFEQYPAFTCNSFSHLPIWWEWNRVALRAFIASDLCKIPDRVCKGLNAKMCVIIDS